MTRRVFFSFHYEKDVNRANIVRNSWVLKGVKEANFIDKAAFERVQRQGETAVQNWIDKQLEGTSVTVVLIGSDTLNRPFVKYEIRESLKRGNGLIGVHISGIKDMVTKQLAPRGNEHSVIGYYDDGRAAYFDEVDDEIYDYCKDDGYSNMGNWIEMAAEQHSK